MATRLETTLIIVDTQIYVILYVCIRFKFIITCINNNKPLTINHLNMIYILLLYYVIYYMFKYNVKLNIRTIFKVIEYIMYCVLVYRRGIARIEYYLLDLLF